MHILHDVLGQRPDFCSGGATVIDQYQRLAIVDTTGGASVALPPRLINQPPRCKLHLTIRRGIVHHVRMCGDHGLERRLRDNRIFEKTTRIAEDLRIRQFGLSDVHHRLRDLPVGRALVPTSRLELGLNGTVLGLQWRGAREAERHAYDDPLFPFGLLE